MEQRFTAEIRDIEPRRTILRTYENKDELKNEINKSFAKYISEFDIIPESLKDKRVEEVDRTPAENLAYQVGWTTLVESAWRIISMVYRYICSSFASGVERHAE